MAARKPKFTRAQIKNHIKKIQEETEKRRPERERRGERVVSIPPDELEKKLKRANSPIIAGGAYTYATSAGGTISFTADLYNPDPTDSFSVFVHVWVGSGNIDPTIGTFLLNVDTRFPRLTEPPSSSGGLTLVHGTYESLIFALRVPTPIERTTYFLQACLMGVYFWGGGEYFDRAVAPFTVT
jgi:hypothetical protein